MLALLFLLKAFCMYTQKRKDSEISSPEGVKMCVCKVWLCSGNIPLGQVISDDFTLLVTSASNFLKVNSCVIASKYLLPEFQAIPVDIRTELVFPRPQFGLCTAFVLTVSYYCVDIMSLTGTAQLKDEMCLFQAKKQKLTSNLPACYPRYKTKKDWKDGLTIFSLIFSNSSLSQLSLCSLMVDSI